MFDVGFAEVLLLSLVALVVLGPERLPRIARTLGGLTRRARSSWLSLKRSIEAEMRAEELKKPLENFKQEFRSTVDEVKSGLDPVAKPFAEPAAKPAANPAAAPAPEATNPGKAPDTDAKEAD